MKPNKSCAAPPPAFLVLGAWDARGSCVNLGAGGAILLRLAMVAAVPDGRRRLGLAVEVLCLLSLLTSPPASPLHSTGQVTNAPAHLDGHLLTSRSAVMLSAIASSKGGMMLTALGDCKTHIGPHLSLEGCQQAVSG
jgi:hypothetical protein